jgi:hypothetical protein
VQLGMIKGFIEAKQPQKVTKLIDDVILEKQYVGTSEREIKLDCDAVKKVFKD